MILYNRDERDGGPGMSKRVGLPLQENSAPAAVQRHSRRSGSVNKSALVAIVILVTTQCFQFVVWINSSNNNNNNNNNSSGSTRIKPSPLPFESNQNLKTFVHDKLIKISADNIWESLLEERASFNGKTIDAMDTIVLEVGMHTARQALHAARRGYTVHGVEPSPLSFQRVQTQLEKETTEIQNRVHLHHRAAGSDSTTLLDFSASGGTGDHVGEFDVWNMKPGKATDPALLAKAGKVVQIQSLRLDDLILGDKSKQTKESLYYLTKIDTQGFEPVVFSGITESLKQHKLQFVLTEFWPAGMDLMIGASTMPERACRAGTDILQQLVDSGYILYALHPTTHPRAPVAAKSFLVDGYQRETPLDDLHAYCDFFYEIARRFSSGDDYRMGYWADVLAVAPQAANLLTGKTPVGQILKKNPWPSRTS